MLCLDVSESLNDKGSTWKERKISIISASII